MTTIARSSIAIAIILWTGRVLSGAEAKIEGPQLVTQIRVVKTDGEYYCHVEILNVTNMATEVPRHVSQMSLRQIAKPDPNIKESQNGVELEATLPPSWAMFYRHVGTIRLGPDEGFVHRLKVGKLEAGVEYSVSAGFAKDSLVPNPAPVRFRAE